MGALSKITLDAVSTPGIFHVDGLTQESAAMTSRILESNRSNHIFTSSEKEMGASLHNHVVYHALTLFALGASPELILSQCKRNFTYQLPPPKLVDEECIREMASGEEGFAKYLGKEEHFLDFVEFFERQLDRDGPEKVLQDYLLGDSDTAKSVFPRLWHGYVHSIMHVGLGLEFKQLPILAEGLAEASVHHDWWYTKFIDTAAEKAQKEPEPKMSIVDILDECLKDPVITGCIDWEYSKQYEAPSEEYPDGRWFVTREPYRDGVVGLALEPLSRLAARYRVSPDDDLERAVAEIINASIYIAASAQRAPHQPHYDFFLIHGANACMWHSVFLKESSITRAQQAHFIETTGRLLFFLWAGVGSPVPQLDYLLNVYKPKVPNRGWEQIFEAACLHEDDGHMIKLIRALAHGEKACKPYDHLPEFRIKQNMFLHCANAAMDSASAQPMVYIRHFDLIRLVGLPEAWDHIPIMAQ
ncbi:hypothetical protein F5Y04DRAFT_291090 [Hypomontagnella monticulosa]|nr:hypothetical protein F5Y04DRAFT_291090 [Hypomontagnella monticulosa]